MTKLARNGKEANAYVLITAAHNEEAYIERIIQSVLSQEVLPRKWVIVSDGSSDRTEEIAGRYAKTHAFICLVRLSRSHGRDFACKVNAIHIGREHLKDADYEFIGNLDADVSVAPSYYPRLLEKFEADPRLGLAGGFVFDEQLGQFRCRRTNSIWSVAHAAQLLRRECFERIGGYAPLKYGGEDWCAEVNARMRGWRVQSFPELRVLHHRVTGTADGLVRSWFRQGRMDFSVGSYPMFEILRCLRRIRETPLVVGAFARLAGFARSYCLGEERIVSEEFVEFLRKEQKERLWCLCSQLSRRTGDRPGLKLVSRPVATRAARL